MMSSTHTVQLELSSTEVRKLLLENRIRLEDVRLCDRSSKETVRSLLLENLCAQLKKTV